MPATHNSDNHAQSTQRITTLFTIVARFEAFTWSGLLIGMFLKHILEVTELGVWFFGRLHGFAFLAYVIVAIMTGLRLRWPWWGTLLAVLAAIPPLVTLPLELWFRRLGWLK
jgi:integral membrane protein